MQKSMIETIQETRVFLNRRETPTLHIGYLLGKPRSAPIFGAFRVTPFDKRFTLIALSMVVRNHNILKTVSFSCPNHPLNLTDLVNAFGDFETEYEEKPNVTRIVWKNFDESEAVESLFSVVEGFKMEKHADGLLLHQPNGGTVVVPLAELMLPMFVFSFKEFERPEDKRNKNPILG